MSIANYIDHVFKALEPRDPQQPRNRFSSAPVEGSTPTDDAGTVGVVDPNYCEICTPKGYGSCRCCIACNE